MTARQSEATEKALRAVDAGKMTPYRAALHYGIALSTIYRALARRRKAAAKQ